MTKKIIKRDIFEDLINHLDSSDITLLLGARQTGKTTALRELEQFLIKKEAISKENILYFNLDILSDFEKFKSQTDFINFLKEQIKLKDKIYILIDEVQKVNNPGLFFKGVYDLHLPIKLILTGSASLEIKAKIVESMAGRKRVFRLFPFNFEEFLKTKKDNEFFLQALKQKSRSVITNNQLKEYLSEYLIFGGYPKVALTESEEEKIRNLDEIFSSFIEKDIVGLLGIDVQESFGFVRLVNLLSAQISSLVNIEEISSTLRMPRKTVEKFIYYLEETFIIKKATPFYANIRKEITKMPKIYFLDLGIRNFNQKIFQKFDERHDKGQLLENYIFTELCQNTDYWYKIYYWRTQDKSEVDFVVEYGNNIIPIEVKAKEMDNPKISRAFRSFIEKYNPNKAFVVNLLCQDKIKINKTEIEFILPFEIRSVICKQIRKSKAIKR